MTKADLTIIVQQDENGWFVGQIEEFPSAISQGQTFEELQTNLIEALALLLETQKQELEKEYAQKTFQKRTLQFAA